MFTLKDNEGCALDQTNTRFEPSIVDVEAYSYLNIYTSFPSISRWQEHDNLNSVGLKLNPEYDLVCVKEEKKEGIWPLCF